MTEDRMVGWYHRFDGYEFEQTLEVGDGQGGLGCFSPRGHKESDITKRLNRTELMEPDAISQFSSVAQSCPTLRDP